METYKQGENILLEENGQHLNEGRYSEIMMDLGPEEQGEQHLYESAHVDQLLQTSFVEISTMGERLDKEEINFNSGESFFQKTNQMFHSDLGNKQYRRMKNKKLQCDIGSGTFHESINSSLIVQGKIRRLEILKMIKLVKLIFKHVRSFKEKIKTDFCSFIMENKKSMQQVLIEMNKMGYKHCEEIGMKNMRILELQQQLAQTSNMNQWLSHKIQSNKQESQQLIQQIQMQKHKSMAQIKDVSMSASLKVEQIQQQNESLEHQIAYYQRELQNVQQICNQHQVSIKRLQYENQKLQKENSCLILKHQQLSRQNQERQHLYNDLNSQFIGINDELSKLIKINELYQRELDSKKQQIQRLQQINSEITKQTEEIIISQLNKYQESFNEQICKIKKEHYNQIQDKNAFIERLLNKQQKLLKTKSKSNHNANNKIFKPVDNNSNRQGLKHSREGDQHIDSNSQSTISIKSVQNFTKIHLANKTNNKGGYSNEQIRCDPNKKGKNEDFPQQYPQKFHQIRQSDIIFKAKEKTANLNIKLSDYMRQKQENVFFASDGMAKATLKVGKKNNTVMMKQERQLLKAFRK